MLIIGPRVPRRGNTFSRGLGRLVLFLLGWKLAGEIPDQPRMVLIGAPHTSNMDGVIGLVTLTALGLRAGTMIKQSAFHGPLGWLLRWMGAIPVDRATARGVVEQTVDAFRATPALLLLVAPEGTRKSAGEWKRGFHHIARGAGVPILPAAADYQRRVITFGPLLWPQADVEADLAQLVRFYNEQGQGRHPERLSRPLCEARGLPWRPHPADPAD
ncbi:MAG TPA: lysophospholipid acyltransferase family protein [Nevskiaceae bacterium]|nr:lysophospholipid acyltransferase family protein [Nevskiaceae bacterium]